MPVFGSAFGAWNDALDPLTTGQAKAFLLALLPPRFVAWFDVSPGSFGDLILEGAGEQFALHVSAGAFEVNANNNPATLAASGLGAWESALDLSETDLALTGTYAGRLAQIIGKLREQGACTVPNVQAAMAPFFDVASPAVIEVVRCNRVKLRTAHTRTNAAGIVIVGGGTVTQTVMVRDDAKVGKAGAQLRLTNFIASDFSDVSVRLTGPSGAFALWDWTAAFQAADPLCLYARADFAGVTIFGTWTIQVSSAAGNVSADDWQLFVEGVGRDGTARDGLGAAMFQWGVFVDPTVIGGAAVLDYDAMEASLFRLNPAHCSPHVILGSASVNPGDKPAIPGDDAAIPGRCIPG